MGVDLTSSSPSAKYFVGVGTTGTSGTLTTQSYGSDWVFDSSTVMTICADENRNYGTNCIVQNLKVAYKLPVQLITMPFSNASNGYFLEIILTYSSDNDWKLFDQRRKRKFACKFTRNPWNRLSL